MKKKIHLDRTSQMRIFSIRIELWCVVVDLFHVKCNHEARDGREMWHAWTEEESLLGCAVRRWEGNIEIDFKEMGLEGRNSFNVAQNGDKWWDFVNTAINCRVEKIREISWLAEQLCAPWGYVLVHERHSCVVRYKIHLMFWYLMTSLKLLKILNNFFVFTKKLWFLLYYCERNRADFVLLTL